jgi:hypothetical protein
MSDELLISIQYYSDVKNISVKKNENNFKNFKNKIKEEFSSYKIDDDVTINYFKKNEDNFTEINDDEEFKNFIEKAPKKHLTLINKQFEKEFTEKHKEQINEIDEIENSSNSDIEKIKLNIEEKGNELIANIEAYSEYLPELLDKDINNYICEYFENIFKCDINPDQTESFENIENKKKCDLCEAYIINEYYFKSNTNKYICKYCESKYRNVNYYDDKGIYFLVRQNNEDKLSDVKAEKSNKILNKMEYTDEIKEEAYKKKLEDMLVNEIKYNIIVSYNYDELIEKKDIHIEAKFPYTNLGKDLGYVKFGCVSNKNNYTNWKGLEGIVFKCEFQNEKLKTNETQDVTFTKRIKKEDLIPGVMFYPLFLKNNKDKAIEGSLRILEIHYILYGDEYI